MTQALDEASRRLGRYLLLQFAVNAGYGLLFGLGVYFVGIPHPLLWGVFGCLLRFVPYIGTPVAAVFPMGMALAVFPGWSQAGLTFVLFLLLELTIANLVEPWLYGSHTGVSSLAILVAAIFWGMLWGPVGLILSTPLTVCLILIGRYIPQLNFLEILLGDEPVLSPQAHFYQRLLALDEEEARDIVEEYLKQNPIGNLYDSVLIPALSLVSTLPFFQRATMKTHGSTTKIRAKKPKNVRNCESWARSGDQAMRDVRTLPTRSGVHRGLPTTGAAERPQNAPTAFLSGLNDCEPGS